jgi:Ig-like domain from next to BRCA1 gene
MKKTPRIISVILLTAIILSACNLPTNQNSQGSNAAVTAAAQTVAAQLLLLTLNAPQGQATLTPSPTGVPATLAPPPTSTTQASATPTCDLAKFVNDVTIPDGTIMTPSQSFTKTWRLQNIGACSWTGYSLVFDSGDAMGGAASSAIATTPSNGFIDVSINLAAPSAPAKYRGYWRLRNPSGGLFPIVNGYHGSSFYVDIKVQAVTPPTLPPAIVFSVTNVAFSVTGTCPNFNYTYSVTTNGAGTVNLHRVFSDGGTDTLPATLVFSSAGTQTSANQPVYMGKPATTTWTDIYIDSPNHQQFGRANFTCP